MVKSFQQIRILVLIDGKKKAATIVLTVFASTFFGIGGVAMFRYAVFKLSNKYTIHQIQTFQNQTTLEGNALNRYPKRRLIIIDNYCLFVDDLIKHYKLTNKKENPYTLTPLTEAVLSHPCFSSALKATESDQICNAIKITPETRNQLALLVKGMLNPKEISRSGGSMPEAQEAYLKFNAYYQSISDEERTALNDYRIRDWRFMLPGLLGMSPTTFGTLYESMDRSCTHSVAGSFIQMLLQLDPKTKFDCSDCKTMAYIVRTFKSRNPRD